ncbi:hypothetical protein OVY29_10315 [Sphingopyxis sp. SE2]|uniref:DUF6602 domain-containing protein n=1 Tax=Sphingopyxis sp. SE2 TaxID=1586240 RepID=UPI0028C00205|nr:DUF6602 domain-containing protein [Sphingopyxis sp. SE2]MDT7529056.1 hypothetical protein [Sphingopyxis sp. SE2]
MGDLLEALRSAEAEQLDASDITHPPTIGAMYEGLTRQLLEVAIPSHLDLRIVRGFAIDGFGARSGEIDCMLVRGAGTPVPYVDGMFEWNVRDVLAVIEVKKKLFGGELADAYDQLRGVAAVTSSWLRGASGPANFSLEASMRRYAECVGELLPAEWAKMDRAKHLIWHSIMFDQIAPVRIMLGYGGYATESGLRRGFEQFLADRLQQHGHGPASLPNLIVTDGAALVKLSGHPYCSPVSPNGWWPIMASSHVNPTLFILEHLWTRISYLSPTPELFGDDLEIEKLSLLISAKPHKIAEPEKWGWQYEVLQAKPADLAAGPEHRPWQPVELDPIQAVVIRQLCREDINTRDRELIEFLKSEDRDPEKFFQALIETTLVARDGENLVLTTVKLEMAMLPDGRDVAADNNTGRLTRWVHRFMTDWSARDDG